MSRWLLLWIFLLALPARADHRAWELPEIRARFRVTGEIFVLDPSGSRLLFKGADWRSWESRAPGEKIRNDWSSSASDYGPIAFHHEWEIRDDGAIHAVIQQFGKIIDKPDGGPVLAEPMQKKDLILHDMESVVWVAIQRPDRRVVVRFTPSFSDEAPAKPIGATPIGGTNMLFRDSDGQVWTEHVTSSGKYSGFVTRFGAVFVSYYPFAGARELGYAAGKSMRLALGGKKVLTIGSETDFLPEGIRAVVYGIFLPLHRRTESIINHDDEKSFLARIRELSR